MKANVCNQSKLLQDTKPREHILKGMAQYGSPSVITSSYQLIFTLNMLFTFVTKLGTSMMTQTVVTLSPHLMF